MASEASTDPKPRAGRGPWNYVPDLPIETSPYFSWPPKPGKILRWLFAGWFPLSERLLILLIALGSWALFHPSLERCKTLEFSWIAEIYLRNLVLLTIVAGGLHWYLYILRGQGDNRRFDARPLKKKGKAFTFQSQVLDNIFWTLASGVTIWTAYEVVMMWAMANGYVPMISLPEDWILLVGLILLLPAWETVHFFLIHRLIHWPPFYKHIHSLHHRNTNIGPWSGLSMHPLEHVLYLSTVLIHFIVPANPMFIIYHLQYFTLSAATSHAGYEGITVGDRVVLHLGNYHHQLHHRYFECNYGGLEIPMDKWTGSFHDGTNPSHQAFLERQKERFQTG